MTGIMKKLSSNAAFSSYSLKSTEVLPVCLSSLHFLQVLLLGGGEYHGPGVRRWGRGRGTVVLFLILIESASPGLNHCFKESLPLPQARSPFGQKSLGLHPPGCATGGLSLTCHWSPMALGSWASSLHICWLFLCISHNSRWCLFAKPSEKLE